jgi:hypothetical protein
MTDENKTTKTTKTRKNNPVRWAVLDPFDRVASTYDELPGSWVGPSVLDPYICIGPEFDSLSDANDWLLKHGRPDHEFQLLRVTKRDIHIEQKRSIVQHVLALTEPSTTEGENDDATEG